ncbi:MAG: mechanosensitive ion channel [Verrucomicrobiae bacterium]|nr:mechanosensitive ion channel [Verrucomicrobiae bacterium]
MSEIIDQISVQVAEFGPNLLAGLAILILGWLVALFAAFLVRKLLDKTVLDNRIAQWLVGTNSKMPIPVEHWVSRAVFYFIMLFVLIAFFSAVKLQAVIEPLNALLQPLLDYLPHLVGGAILVLIGWVVATILKKILSGALKLAKLDEKLGGAIGRDGKGLILSDALAETAYWLVWLFFLPSILQALRMQALLEPVTTLLNKVFEFLPNLVSAGAIGLVGWFIARVAQRLVQSLLVAAGADQLGEKWGLNASLGKQKLSGVLGLVVYFVILVPVLISALAALKLDVITQPASDMLGKILGALPNVIGALVILLIATLIGKVVSGLVTNLLAGLGFNNVLVRLGLTKTPAQGKQAPAAIIGLLVFAVILLFASIAAAELLEFQAVGTLIKDFIGFAGHVIMGVVILGLGLWLAEFVSKAIATASSRHAAGLATFTRIVILALAGAMALRQTGLANDIVNLAFGLTLGAVAVATALAFGLGGRETASRMLEDWSKRSKENSDK